MLQLKHIKKDYFAGNNVVHALKGIDLQFRESEFVSILGPSGCGKTTMLNIIGGLDQYTEGDLVIDGVSTKEFRDREWDSYRNHSIGFVFQSYNLIPHQTVLRNVELALTLSGVSKSERKSRTIKALEQVGLGDQMYKKPSEMSGGQMQRVAIARALVNDPQIILADEPTGALDTETSVQVMEILKEVAKDRLVIMVTHNPELAEQYSTRIIRMLDGVITDDTMPLTKEEQKQYGENTRNNRGAEAKKPSMSLATSFGLSLNNLFTKKGRTLLTAFAGSIGIIGIALIFAVSQGMTNYIDALQEDTLSSYPLTIEETTMDLSAMLQTFMGSDDGEPEKEHEKDAVYSQSILFDMVNSFNDLDNIENNLKAFKEYLEKEQNDSSELRDALNGVKYTYGLDLLVYTKDVDGNIIRSDTQEMLMNILSENFGMDMTTMLNMGEDRGLSMDSLGSVMSLPGGTSINLWTEMLSGQDGSLISPVLKNQYDVVYGSWPTQANEIVLVVNENNELDDLTLYALGLKSENEIDEIFEATQNREQIDTSQQKWSYEEICNMDFRVALSADCYVLDESTGVYTDLRSTEAGMQYVYDNAMALKVTGIIRPSERATSAMLNGSIGYTKELTEYVIEHAHNSDVVKAQMEDTTKDIFTGLPFKANTGSLTQEEKEKEFRAYVASLDEAGRADVYIKMMSIPTQEQIDAAVEQSMGSMDREKMESMMLQAMKGQMGMAEETIQNYVDSMDDEELKEIFKQMIASQVRTQMAAQVQQQMGSMEPAQLAAALDMDAYTIEQCAMYYDEILKFSESTYEANLIQLGCVELDSPASISLYVSSFKSKDVIEKAISDYNNSVDKISQIRYTDYVDLMMSSVTTIINAVTYVLIGFVAISLIVSSIMIGVITLISVQERTKEIGILRSIGASKKNVANMFNAETTIIGFVSGILGIGVTYLLCIPINAVIYNLTGIKNLRTSLPAGVAIILVIISVVLTLFAGIIPSRSASKKDPVVALRTE